MQSLDFEPHSHQKKKKKKKKAKDNVIPSEVIRVPTLNSTKVF
jgi:hypothetical protein